MIEDNLSEGTIALFVQGCGGDINPVALQGRRPPARRRAAGQHARPEHAARPSARSRPPRPTTAHSRFNEILALPRADLAERIAALEAEQKKLLGVADRDEPQPEDVPALVVKYNLAGEFPSDYSHRYLHEQSLGREDLWQARRRTTARTWSSTSEHPTSWSN